MSIILKGIDLPTKYDSSYFLKVSPDGVFQGEDFAYTKLFSGEAIQIPKGHGRLIDADALFKDLREQQIPFNSDINSAIIVAPTIFESEEE